MAIKISQMALVSTFSGSDSFEIVQSGATKRMQASGSWTLGNLTVSGTFITPQVGTGAASNLSLTTSGGTQLVVSHTASAVNYLQATGGAATFPAILSAQGSDSNVGLSFQTRGTGSHLFQTNGATTQVEVVHNASANRWITLTGSNGGNCQIGTSAGNMNFGFAKAHINGGMSVQNGLIDTESTGAFGIATNSGSVQFQVTHTASANRFITVTGSNGGNPAITVSAGALALGAASTDIQWLRTNIALGGGAAPTLGTIGGSGPAAAAQRNWLRFIESDGTASFIPVWR